MRALRAALVVTIALAAGDALAFAPNISKLQISSGAAFTYVQGQSYAGGGKSIVATVQAMTTWSDWDSVESRISVRLDPALRPRNVSVSFGAESGGANVAADANCARTYPTYGGCTVHNLGMASFASLWVVQVSGATEIDLIPPSPLGQVAGGQDLVITIDFDVLPAAIGPTTQTAVYVRGTEQGYGGSTTTAGGTQDRALDPVSHAVAPLMATVLLSPPLQTTVRGAPAVTLNVSATDQNGDPVGPSGVVVSLADERLGSAGGPQVPVGERGVLTQTGPGTRAYTPGPVARSQPVLATFSAGSATAEIDVNVGTIGAFQLQPPVATIGVTGSQQFVPQNATNTQGGAELLAPSDVVYSLSAGAHATVDASGNVSADASFLRTMPEMITVTATKGSATATATLTIMPTAITDCALTVAKPSLAITEETTVTLTANNGAFDLTQSATYTVDQPDVLQANGTTFLALKGGVTATITAHAAVCPQPPPTATVTIRAPQQGDLLAIDLEPKEIPALIVGARTTIRAVGVYFGGERKPITPDAWAHGPGIAFTDEVARQGAPTEREIVALAPGASTVTVSYRGLADATVSLQVDEAYLTLRWQIQKRTVRQGDFVDATLIATTDALGAHGGVTLRAQIASGLQPVAKQTEWTIDVPAGRSEQRIAVPLMAVASSGVFQLAASAFDPQIADPIAAAPPEQVRILADPELSEALLVGRVFDDRNQNGRSDDGEPGIAGVTIGLTSGVFVTTDKDGNYHVPALLPESIVAKIDVNTLPHVAPLTTRERVAMTLTPGQIFRADFGVDLSEPKPPALTQDRAKAPRIVNGEYVLPLLFDGKEARTARVALKAVRNEAIVTATGENGTIGHYKVVVRRFGDTFVVDPPALVRVEYPPPPESTHFLVALGEGILAVEPRARTFQEGLYWDGRLAFAYRGRIKGKVLIDAGMDTSLQDIPTFFQRDVRRVFRNLDPEQYYPVYGDTSSLVDERETGQKLYVRLEAGPVMAKYGGFRTGLSDNQYGRYDRALVGAAARFMMDGHKIFVFYAKPESQHVHDDLYVTGSSLYYLSQKSVVEGSEQIWLETRQQRTGIVRDRKKLTPGADYQVDYLSGRVLLENTLSSASPSTSALRQSTADGDERWLMIDYEVVANLAAAGNGDVVGGRVSERPVKGLELGATGVTEIRAGGDHYWMVGGDVTVNVWQPLSFHAEYAHSERTLQSRALSYDGGLTFAALPNAGDPKGDAMLARLSFDYKDFKAEAYGRYRTSGFNDTASSPGDRTLQYGGTLRSPDFHGFQAALTLDDLRREASYNTVQNGALRLGRMMSELELKQAIGPVTLLAAVRYAHVAPGFGVGREVVVGGGVVWQIVPRLAIGAMHQQPVLREGDRVFDSLGRDTQLLTRFVVGKDVEAEAAIGYGERGINGRATVLVPVNEDTKLTAGMVYGGTTVAEGVSVGLRRKTADGTLVYADNQYQKTNLLGGAQLNGANSVQGPAASNGPAVQTHTAGLETKLFGAHAISVSGEAGKRNPGGGFDAIVERYGAGIGHAYTTPRFTLRSRIEARFDSVTAADPNGAQWLSATPNQRTLAGFVRGDWKATETLSFAAWFKGSQSVATKTGDPPIADTAEAAFGFAYRPQASFKPTLFGRYAYTHDRLPPTQNPQGIVTDAHIASLSFTIDPWKYIGALGKVAAKAGSLRMVGVGSQDLLSILAIPRVNVHVTSIFDVSAEYRVCHDKYVGTQHGFLAELSVLVGDFVRLGGGYNLSDIGEASVDCRAQGARGFFIRAQAMY